ncbi:unnamed protein product [Peronospora belbahrii]|uniref:CxC2-like cysteine cluster KDZ transposase-associated domain-containing protein n=1 Tax=Peronospora belbahrii TaxID=622444 RepID=A0ABN8CWG5_9STRA|nr:unnamed protein product [Peronospora belbahrii]
MSVVTHEGCAQFTANVLTQHSKNTSRDEFLSLSKTYVSSLNKPGEKERGGGITYRLVAYYMMVCGGTFCELLCTKHCRVDFHAKNIFEGDTYCRIHFDGIVHLNKSCTEKCDPMYMDNLCFTAWHPNSAFHIEVTDFNSDLCIAQFNVSLFQLLQREADMFIRTNPILTSLRKPLRHFSLNNEMNQAQLTIHGEHCSTLDNKEQSELSPPHGSKLQPGEKLGLALIELNYVEYKEDLLRVRAHEDAYLLKRKEKEFSVESLRITIERFGRALKVFQGIDANYASIILWKNKKKSAVCFATFVYMCVFADFEYALSYICGAVLMYMLYRLHLRLEGAYVARWIGYEEYEFEQEEQQKLYRPLADLHVAVHEAHLSHETDSLLIESQSRMKDISSSKLGYYVRIKYRPNDKQSKTRDMVFNPSGYDEAIVAWTNVVSKSRNPTWRKTSLPSAATVLAANLRKALPFRNFNVSWRHDSKICTCDQCSAHQRSLNDAADASAAATSCGVDHHAFYFPIPQASRKNFSGHDDLVPWPSFPGLLQFDLCVSLSGEAKESPDLIAATTTIPLRSLLKQNGQSCELRLPLSSFSTPNDNCALPSQHSKELDGNFLVAHVGFEIPEESKMSSNEKCFVSKKCELEEVRPAQPTVSRKKRRVGHVERNFSEFVCESMVEKEKSKVLGAHLLDAFWKAKDTIRQLQTEIGRACGALACAENLLNWTHPYCGRWAILVFGLTEFGAVFVNDAPTSKRLKKIVWNYLSSLPTDQDLIELYERERAIYMKTRKVQQEKDEETALRLRYHALWIGNVSTKAEGERHAKKLLPVRAAT